MRSALKYAIKVMILSMMVSLVSTMFGFFAGAAFFMGMMVWVGWRLEKQQRQQSISQPVQDPLMQDALNCPEELLKPMISARITDLIERDPYVFVMTKRWADTVSHPVRIKLDLSILPTGEGVAKGDVAFLKSLRIAPEEIE